MSQSGYFILVGRWPYGQKSYSWKSEGQKSEDRKSEDRKSEDQKPKAICPDGQKFKDQKSTWSIWPEVRLARSPDSQ